MRRDKISPQNRDRIGTKKAKNNAFLKYNQIIISIIEKRKRSGKIPFSPLKVSEARNPLFCGLF
jgi:hypothetical protein